MAELLEQSLKEFADALASRSAVPGGGGASALAGALGAALGSMVGELTVGKKTYAAVEDEMRELLARAHELRERLLDCVERDAAAFAPLAKAYGIPKDDPERDAVLERCLHDAAAVPLEILDLCCEAIALQRRFADKGSRLAVSDAATGAALCRGALYGAAANVRVNTKLMRDRAWAEETEAHVAARLAEYGALADEIFMDVYGRDR